MKDNSMDLLALRSRAGQSRPSVAARPGCRGGGGFGRRRVPRLRLPPRHPRPGAVAGIPASPTATARRFPTAGWGRLTYNPSAGLLLKFVGDLVYLVLLEGSNLNALVNGAVSLYDRGIQRHRVTWVREMTRQQVQQAGGWGGDGRAHPRPVAPAGRGAERGGVVGAIPGLALEGVPPQGVRARVASDRRAQKEVEGRKSSRPPWYPVPRPSASSRPWPRPSRLGLQRPWHHHLRHGPSVVVE